MKSKFLLSVAVLAVLAGVAAGQCWGQVPPAQLVPPAPQQPSGLQKLIDATCKVEVWRKDGKGFKLACSGSGVCFAQTEKDMLVLTAHHVVADTYSGSWASVRFPGGTLAWAKVLSSDQCRDVAVLVSAAADKVPAVPISTVGVQAGVGVLKVGYPHGVGPKYSRGAISKLHYPSLTDMVVSLNPGTDSGDSGGPVFWESQATVVGIVSAKATKVGPSATTFCCELESIKSFTSQTCLGFFKKTPPAPPIIINPPPVGGADFLSGLKKIADQQDDFAKTLAKIAGELDEIKKSAGKPPDSEHKPVPIPIEQKDKPKEKQVDQQPAQPVSHPILSVLADGVGFALPIGLTALGLGGAAIPAAFAWRLLRGAGTRVVANIDARKATGQGVQTGVLPVQQNPGQVVVNQQPAQQPQIFMQHDPVGVPVGNEVADAYAWAHQKAMEQFPGMTGVVQTIESLAKQRLSGKGIVTNG